ncbi:MAG: response regulator transcription factor [Deltaproteobacteria bacterium]|nr:response regulator transcription factor [Deltaproteobacteria bacterium]MBW2415596.1 response regulator transcription factor [Deltaproteobacteria bacterium]
METRILLVEDEEHLARGLQFNLETEGYSVEVCERGETALERLSNGSEFELVLLDVMLPGISGIDVLERLRGRGNAVPVLLLTARDTEEDIVVGLDAGADDYLTKPFSLPVLMARVRTLLRRAPKATETATFTIGDCTVYPDRFEVERGGERSPLTAKELGLLLLLQRRRGSAVSRGEILQDVWDLHPETKTRVVDTFMLRLRKLIEPDPSSPRYLQSVRAFGYRLLDEEPD